MNLQYPIHYEDALSPKSRYSCDLLCRCLNDVFNPETKKASVSKYFQNDYFKIIRNEILKDRVLIAFDTDNIVMALHEFCIMTKEFSVEDCSIYYVRDTFYSSSNPKYNTNLCLIFAPCTLLDADHFLVQLNHFDRNCINVTKLPFGKIFDYTYIYPIEIKSFENDSFLISTILSQEQLFSLIHEDEFVIMFNNLNDLDASYAMYLLGESLQFKFPLRWYNSRLYIAKCGYTQGLEISKKFGEILIDIAKLNVAYRKGLRSNKGTADAKERSFVFENEFYTAGTVDTINATSNDLGNIRNVVYAVTDLDKEYYKSLGYSIFDDEPYKYNVPLSWITTEKDGQIKTNYYVPTTSGILVDIEITNDKYSKTVEDKLKELLNSGTLIRQRARNIMKSYDLIPYDLF